MMKQTLLFLLLTTIAAEIFPSAVAYDITVPDWGNVWGNIRLTGNAWSATRLVRILQAVSVNISGMTPANRPRTSVVQIPAIPGASLYRGMVTQRGCQYDLTFRMQSPLLPGNIPAPMLVSAVDVLSFRQLSADIFKERMVRGFTPQRLSFIAAGPATLLTFASVPVAGIVAGTGPGMAELTAKIRTCSGGSRLLRELEGHIGLEEHPLVHLDDEAVRSTIHERLLAGGILPTQPRPQQQQQRQRQRQQSVAQSVRPVIRPKGTNLGNNIRQRMHASGSAATTATTPSAPPPTSTPPPNAPPASPAKPPPSPPPPPQAFYGMFSGGGPATPLIADFYASNVDIMDNSAKVTFNGIGGGRWQSSRQYSSGVFSANIQCPQGKAFSGLQLDFVLDVAKTGASSRQRIGFQFSGADATKFTAVSFVMGQDNSVTVPLNFSCSEGMHQYTLYWDTQRISWYVDQTWITSVFPSNGAILPIEPLFLYGGLSHDLGAMRMPGAGSGIGRWSGINVITPLPNSVGPSPPPLVMPPADFPRDLPTQLLTNLQVDYSLDHCEGCLTSTDGSAVIRMDNKADGSRFRSPLPLAFALVSADIKCPEEEANGTVAAFYTSSWEGAESRDEIDFEWTLKNKRGVQTNYFVGGIGGNEKFVKLDFDCSDGFHNYALLWTPSHLVWYVDKKPVRVLQNVTGKPYPSQQSYVYSSYWDASFICNGCWAGKRADSTKADPNWALRVQYKDVRVSGPLITGGY